MNRYFGQPLLLTLLSGMVVLQNIVPSRIALRMSEPISITSLRFVRVRLAFTRLAMARIAPLALASVRSAPLRLTIDKLKIDQSFVRDCKGGLNDGGIVMAIIGMGRSLKLKVIAEGVETLMQADFLKLNGCDEVQGYFYGKPMEGGELARLLGCDVRKCGVDAPW